MDCPRRLRRVRQAGAFAGGIDQPVPVCTMPARTGFFVRCPLALSAIDRDRDWDRERPVRLSVCPRRDGRLGTCRWISMFSLSSTGPDSSSTIPHRGLLPFYGLEPEVFCAKGAFWAVALGRTH